ncbi:MULTISPECIES: Clp protease N-terminal domain-containing protein [unclassified Aeromicrobium]|uniref:Clp protease N-terminal domain-containing protein n=1 Tax=unclassified Aeromicrobium TaxID=2633570 RepID=UPI00396AF825
MPKINVYLPDELAARVKDARIPVSRICQTALAEAVDDLERPAVEAESLPVAEGVDMPFNPHVAGFVRSAIERATRRGSDEVGTADVLRGLLDEDESLILHAMENAGFSRTRIAESLDRHAPPEPEDSEDGQGEPRLSEDALRVLRIANDEAHERHGDSINGSHVIVGLLADEGPAGRALRDLGVQDVITPAALTILNEGIAYGRATSGRGDRPQLLALADIVARLDRIERHLQEGTLP